MACTPRKIVHFAVDESPNEFDSPFSNASSESFSSTSNLQYINSQLVAHGFARSPGLSIDGISDEDGKGIVKCVQGLLGQRMEDMTRIEDLSTKLRNMSYDYDRLTSMHRTSLEKAATSEKETSLYKARLAAATRSLESSQSAHKHTTAELQRTRSSLLSVRQTQSVELKRREKEAEKMVEKWTKIADAQIKLGAASAGLTFKLSHANALVGSSVEDVIGKGKGMLEQALDDSEQARKELREENKKLKDIIVNAVNELSAVLHTARRIMGDDDEPAYCTMATLFPMSPAGAANDKLNSLWSSLREVLSLVSKQITVAPTPTTRPSSESVDNKTQSGGDVQHLQVLVDELRAELEQSQKQVNTYAVQCQVLLDNKNETLHEDQSKFTETAIKLGREKAVLEAGRIKVLEQTRTWQGSTIHNDLTSTSRARPSVSGFQPPANEQMQLMQNLRKSRRKSPMEGGSPKASRRSPGKPSAGVIVGKAGVGTGKRLRTSTRLLSLSPKPPRRVEPSFETEVIPRLPAPTFGLSPTPPLPILSTAFVLPAPSPMSSIPLQPDLLYLLKPPVAGDEVPRSRSASTLSPADSESGSDSDTSPHALSFPKSASVPNFPSSSSDPVSRPSTTDAAAPPGEAPCTPPAVRRPFPMAKPHAMHMTHAYSPARPSPLSRILMLADSPVSPPAGVPATIYESEEEVVGGDEGGRRVRGVMLEAEGAEEEGRDGGPLRDRKGEVNGDGLVKRQSVAGKRGEEEQGERRKVKKASREKGKERTPAVGGAKDGDAAASEKENVLLVRKTKTKAAAAGSGAKSRSRVSQPAATMLGEQQQQKSATSSTAGSKPKPNSATAKNAAAPTSMKGGARRVPIGSIEAAPGPGWRG